MGLNDLYEKYKQVFGEYPNTFALPVLDDDFHLKMEQAIKEKKPIWSFYYETDPSLDNNIDI